jgi:protein TonB
MPWAVAAALAAHLLLLLGIGIELPEPPPALVRTLEVVTVEQPGHVVGEPPPEAVRAQVDRTGETPLALPEVAAGSAAQAPPEAPDTPPASEPPPPAAGAETAADPADLAAQPQTQQTQPAAAQPRPQAPGADTPAPTAPTRQLLDNTPETMAGILTGLGESVPLPDLQTPAPEPASAPEARTPDASTIFASRSDEIAALNARISARNTAAGRERRKAINTSTKEYRYASYMEAWRRKVERIGNLNYPQEAKEKALFGSLILHVAVRADGSLEGVRVVRSSGHDVLDDAAVKIVRLAAPFAPFPDDIKAETDVLDITRVWQFQRNHRLGWND